MRLLLLAAVAVVGTLAALILGKRHARRFQRSRRIRVDRFKLKRRHAEIELEVFGNRQVVDAIRDYAKEHHVTIEQATAQARTYLREIVPKFNLLAYYRFGAPLAKTLMKFLYRPVVEQSRLRAFNDSAPKNAVVVYLINHRSNADYVLVAHMLFEFISLSYAVGEWARVWPLNHLFKWFGGYFVRRRYREPLYHAVLSTFVQTITRNGVTQGIFLEGGLTRDGAFRKPKIGMLDYIVTAKRDPSFTGPLILIPTAVNYDRVLEDRNLTEELLGKEDRRSKSEKLNTTFEFVFKNTIRSAVRRFKRYGYAIVTFGEPIVVDDFIAREPALLADSFEARKAALQRLSDLVMDEISRVLPPTPVTLTAAVLAAAPRPLTDREIATAIEELLAERWPSARSLLREKDGRAIWNYACRILQLRKLVLPAERWHDDLFGEGGAPELEDAWQWNPDETLLRSYYANALVPYAEVKARGWER